MSVLLSVQITLLIDFKSESSEQNMRTETEYALNTACHYLEQSPLRDPTGSIQYRVDRLSIL